MLNVTSKSESENLWVYWNLSRHATWHQRSHQIALKEGNQNPQNNMIASFSFTSTAHATQLRGWNFDSMTKFNASTGKEYWQYCLWMICLWYRSRLKQVGFTVSSLFFRDRQAAVGSSLRMDVILANTSLLLNTLRKKMISWSKTWSISWQLHSRIGKIAYIIEQPNK